MPSLKNIALRPFFLLLLIASAAKGQDLPTKDSRMGITLSLNCAFGTHFQRAGVNVNFYYAMNHVQVSSELRTYFSFKNLGPKFIYPELVLSPGLLFGYGRYTEYTNPFYNSVANHTGYSNSVGYSYNAYFNRRKTTQQTGIISLQFDQISLITENDILAKPMLDRFRTAAFLIQYQYKDQFQAAINCTMWTGQMGKKQSSEKDEFYYHCYMDTSEAVYPNTSHGLLSGQFKYNVGYVQNIQANAGIDAEQIRNAVQNRFIHDMRWIPEKWKKAKNCHIPMIGQKGEQYLYEEGQQIRSPKLYLNVFSNANLFY